MHFVSERCAFSACQLVRQVSDRGMCVWPTKDHAYVDRQQPFPRARSARRTAEMGGDPRNPMAAAREIVASVII